MRFICCCLTVAMTVCMLAASTVGVEIEHERQLHKAYGKGGVFNMMMWNKGYYKGKGMYNKGGGGYGFMMWNKGYYKGKGMYNKGGGGYGFMMWNKGYHKGNGYYKGKGTMMWSKGSYKGTKGKWKGKGKGHNKPPSSPPPETTSNTNAETSPTSSPTEGIETSPSPPEDGTVLSQVATFDGNGIFGKKEFPKLDVFEDTLVLAGKCERDSGNFCAVIFVRVEDTWKEQGGEFIVESDDVGILDVHIDGNTIVFHVGYRAYVFVRDSDTWEAAGEIPLTGFGPESFALSGDDYVVCGRTSDGPNCDMFSRSGGTWSQKLFSLEAVDGARTWESFNLGRSVAMDGDTVVLGSFTEFEDPGAVYVYTRSNNAWSFQQRLAPLAEDGDILQFGVSVAVDADTLVVTAVGDPVVRNVDDRVALSRKIYGFVYVRTGSSWERQATLDPQKDPPDSVDGPLFRNESKRPPIALDGNIVVLGVNEFRYGFCNSLGAAYVYERFGAAWFPTQRLLPDTSGENLGFGSLIGVSKGTVVVLSQDDDKFYVFESGTELPPGPGEDLSCGYTPYCQCFQIYCNC